MPRSDPRTFAGADAARRRETIMIADGTSCDLEWGFLPRDSLCVNRSEMLLSLVPPKLATLRGPREKRGYRSTGLRSLDRAYHAWPIGPESTMHMCLVSWRDRSLTAGYVEKRERAPQKMTGIVRSTAIKPATHEPSVRASAGVSCIEMPGLAMRCNSAMSGFVYFFPGSAPYLGMDRCLNTNAEDDH